METLPDFISGIGTSLVTGVFILGSMVGLIWFVYKKYIKTNTTGKSLKIILLEAALLFLAVVECNNSANAVAESEEGMSFAVRLGVHAALVLVNTILMYNIWQQVREAVQASQVLVELFNMKNTWARFAQIIFNFIKQWLDVFGCIVMGIGALYANMYLMGVSTGQLDLVLHCTFVEYMTETVEFTDGTFGEVAVPFWDVVAMMRDDVAGNLFISYLHVGMIFLLGVIATDDKIDKIEAKKGPTQPNYPIDQVCGYYAKHISDAVTSGAAMNTSTVLALIKVDPKREFEWELKMTELFEAAKTFGDDAKDPTKTMAEKVEANERKLTVHDSMEKLLREIDDYATSYTKPSTTP
jgi:hypothetical protein